MTELEAEELARSAHEQNWGFRGGLQEVMAQPLLNVRLPRWMARQWTVTTLAMRYTRGTLDGTGFRKAPPDNQVNTVEGGLRNLEPFKMTLNWGNGGVQETALIDYPWAGNSFSFYASQFQLSLNTLDPATVAIITELGLPPLLGAFVCPSSGRWQELGAGPLNTTSQFAMSSEDDPVYIPIPARARAYRITYQTPPVDEPPGTADVGLRVVQVTGQFSSLTVLSQDRYGWRFGLGETYFSLQDIAVNTIDGGIQNQGIWAQRLKNNVGIIESGATGLYIAMTTDAEVGNTNGELTVQFALDLG